MHEFENLEQYDLVLFFCSQQGENLFKLDPSFKLVDDASRIASDTDSDQLKEALDDFCEYRPSG